MKEIRIGLIGAGWMGTFYAAGFYNVRKAYGSEVVASFEVVADPVDAAASKAMDTFGFKKKTADWHDVINDPDVDLVVITTPNFTHAEIAIAAAKAGKHIVCEKPMAMNKEEADEMVKAVEEAGVISLVDFIYRKLPISMHAKELVESGDLGEITTFRGEFDCSYCANPNTAMKWRQYAEFAGTGALGDLTSHLLSLSDLIVGSTLGEVVEVNAVWDTAYPKRPVKEGSSEMADVDTDDQIYILLKYSSGRIGQLSSSRITCGKPTSLAYEIQGSKGTLKYNLERMNELQYFKEDGDTKNLGFKTLFGNTAHGEYFNFSQLNSLGISYADVMGIQSHKILKAIADNTPIDSDIAYGAYVDKVCFAIEKSAREGRWVKVSEI